MNNSNGSDGIKRDFNNGDLDITVTVRHNDNENDANGQGFDPGAPAPISRPKNKRRVFTTIILVFCALSVIAVFSDNITYSTHARRPLSAGVIADAGYYTDNTGFIENELTLIKGLEVFYSVTGIQPYVYITDNIDGSKSPTADQLKGFAEGLYKRLFTDEAHLLMVFVYSGGGYMDCYVCGTQCAYFFDPEAETILREYVSKYYSDNSYKGSEVLSRAFTMAADRMTTVTVSPWIVLIICAAISGVTIWLYVRHRKKEKQASIDKKTEEMLNIPLEKFGDPEIEELAKKYEDPPQK